MNAYLSDEDIANLLENPNKWFEELEENKEISLYEEQFNHYQKIHDIHVFFHELELLANKQLSKFDTLSSEQTVNEVDLQ